MNCKETQKKFSQFFDDLLNGYKNTALLDHISKCESCKRAWNRFINIVNSLRCLPHEEPPFDITPGVMARIHELEKRECWWRKLLALDSLAPLLGTVVVIMLVLGSVILYQKVNNTKGVLEVTNAPERLDVKTHPGDGILRKTAIPKGRFAATVSPLSGKRYTVVTLYVDDIDQAERKITTLASRVFVDRNFRTNPNQAPRKILTQYRIDIPATELDSLLRELTKIGEINHSVNHGKAAMGKGRYALEPGAMGRIQGMEMRFAGDTPEGAGNRRKMGQGLHIDVPMVPVNVVVVYRGHRSKK